VRTYYDRRAPEYDEWYLGEGRFADRERRGWDEEVGQLRATLAELAPARTLDIACGTGFLTRHLRGEVVGLDQSEAMLEEARSQAPNATYGRGDALALPFEDGEFARVLTAHFYGHLKYAERQAFLGEARRVAPELIVVDTARREDVPAEEWVERILNDGSRWRVYKRYFEPEALAAELGGGRTLFAGRWFVVVQA
jgi:ubiquinone/menaquinone biosynthesis C-methylase UbiE